MLLHLLNKRYQSRDWVGEWYRVLKERGENDICTFIRKSFDGDKELNSDVHTFSHQTMDGTSAIPHFFNINGGNVTPRKSSYLKKISFWKSLKLTYKSLSVKPKNSSKWKFFNEEEKLSDVTEIATLMLSSEETRKFKEYCKSNKTSENAIFVKEMTELVADINEDLNIPQTWLFPVNMRGIVSKNNPTSNHSSFIPLDVTTHSTVSNIQEQMLTRLKSLEYVGIWWVHHIGVLFGRKKMAKLSSNSSKKNYWLGTISNVGEWESPQNYEALGPKEGWFFVAPGSKNFPICFVILTMNKRLCFSLRIHPSICSNSLETANQFLTSLKERINSLS